MHGSGWRVLAHPPAAIRGWCDPVRGHSTPRRNRSMRLAIGPAVCVRRQRPQAPRPPARARVRAERVEDRRRERVVAASGVDRPASLIALLGIACRSGGCPPDPASRDIVGDLRAPRRTARGPFAVSAVRAGPGRSARRAADENSARVSPGVRPAMASSTEAPVVVASRPSAGASTARRATGIGRQPPPPQRTAQPRRRTRRDGCGRARWRGRRPSPRPRRRSDPATRSRSSAQARGAALPRIAAQLVDPAAGRWRRRPRSRPRTPRRSAAR